MVHGTMASTQVSTGQHVCSFAAPNNRCFSGKRQRHPPPPRPVYPKGHRVGSAPQLFCYGKVSTFMAPICLPYSHHLPQGRPSIALNIFGPNGRLNNISRTLL